MTEHHEHPDESERPFHGAASRPSPSPWSPPPATPPPPGASPTPPGYGGGYAGRFGASPPPPTAPPTTRTTTPPPGRRKGVAVVAAAAAMFAAGVGGVMVGKDIAEPGSGPITATGGVATQTVSTTPGPVDPHSSEPVAAVAASLGPAVVQIETSSGLGSGFIYDKSGLILTAAHVTDGASTVEVRLADGTRASGRVVGSDDSTDVAVVQIESDGDLPVATLATGVKLEVGQTAIAIGSPFGLDQTVTAGIVSAIGRSTETPGGVIPAIQTDAPINSGNSGGALADRQGRVIGINDSIITGNRQSSGNVGVGFAIPIDIAKTVADKIVAGESTEAGYLGVSGADATGERAGAVITEVEDGSPAAAAGLTTDDVVTGIDGHQVASMIDLAARIRTNPPETKVSLTVLRDGKERNVEVTLGIAAPR